MYVLAHSDHPPDDQQRCSDLHALPVPQKQHPPLALRQHKKSCLVLTKVLLESQHPCKNVPDMVYQHPCQSVCHQPHAEPNCTFSRILLRFFLFPFPYRLVKGKGRFQNCSTLGDVTVRSVLICTASDDASCLEPVICTYVRL